MSGEAVSRRYLRGSRKRFHKAHYANLNPILTHVSPREHQTDLRAWLRSKERCCSRSVILAAIADRLEGKLTNASALLGLREGILAHLAERSTEDRFPLTPQHIVHDVRQVIPPDGIVALDNGMYKIWFARNYRTSVANTLLLDNALATMGAVFLRRSRRR
jgi:thiamine pyrophosphate-dependent acetolactate synthase large subunit-like protein